MSLTSQGAYNGGVLTSDLPALTALMLQRSDQGWLRLDRFIDLALYAPGLGYYSKPGQKFGAQGDFITAPSIGPLFGQTLARQIHAWITAGCPPVVTEFGAGDGCLALQILDALPAVRYQIMDLSGSLRTHQARQLEKFSNRIQWLNHLPGDLSGIVLGNELLDAMPVRQFMHSLNESGESVWSEGGARWDPASRTWREAFCPAPLDLIDLIKAQVPNFASLAEGYVGEVSEAIPAWIASIAPLIKKGVLLLIDYGFGAQEFYHPQRHMGTLMAHYRHRADPQILRTPGEQDITAHVNFSLVADQLTAHGGKLLGYTTQASFLLNSGILEFIQSATSDLASNPRIAAQRNQALQTLVSEAEMGELFKAIAACYGFSDQDLDLLQKPGFSRGQRWHQL